VPTNGKPVENAVRLTRLKWVQAQVASSWKLWRDLP